MDDSSLSDISVESTESCPVATFLGLKPSLRFRPHGSSQKPHVVLRRVNGGNETTGVVCFSLFAQKRIEVKSGKEILMTFEGSDGRAFLFEGDAREREDEGEEDLTQVADEDEEDEEEKESFLSHSVAMPPKMRRFWKKPEEVTAVVESTTTRYDSVGVQVEPEYGCASVQAQPDYGSASIQARPEYECASVQVQPDYGDTSVQAHPEYHCSSVQVEPRYESVFVQAEPILTSIKIQTVANTLVSVSSQGDPPASTIPRVPTQVETRASLGTPVIDLTYSPSRWSPGVVSEKVFPVEGSFLQEKERSSSPMELESPPECFSLMGLESPPESLPSSYISSSVLRNLTPDAPQVRLDSLSELHNLVSSFSGGNERQKMLGVNNGATSVCTPQCCATSSASEELPPPSSYTITTEGVSLSHSEEPLTSSSVANEKKEDVPDTSNETSSKPLSRGKISRNSFVSSGVLTDFVSLSSRGASVSKAEPDTKPIMEDKSSISLQSSQKSVGTHQSSAAAANAVASSSKVTLDSASTLAQVSAMIPRSVKGVRKPAKERYSAMQSSVSSTVPAKRPAPVTKALPPPAPSTFDNPLGIRSTSTSLITRVVPSVPKALTGAVATSKKRVIVGGNWGPSKRGSASTVATQNLLLDSSPLAKVELVSPTFPELEFHDSPSPPDGPPEDIPPPPPSPPRKKISIRPLVKKAPSAAAQIDTSAVQKWLSSDSLSISPVEQKPFSQLFAPKKGLKDRISDSPSLSLQDRISKSPILSLADRISDNIGDQIVNGPHIEHNSTVPSPTTARKTSQLASIPQALNHPLPPKPVAIARSSRNNDPLPRVKRERSLSPDVSVKKRRRDCPSLTSLHSVKLRSDGNGDVSIKGIAVSSNGEIFALNCADRTVRIWDNTTRSEVARLTHETVVITVKWMEDDVGVIVLGGDGVVSKWTRMGPNRWVWAKLVDAWRDNLEDENICLAYKRDKIAVSYVRTGVKIWIYKKGSWQLQCPILRQNVTAIKFLEDGVTLVGGTKDGVLWSSEIPGGMLRAWTFLRHPVSCIDTSSPGTLVLITAGSAAYLVRLPSNVGQARVEQVYSPPDGEFSAILAAKGKGVLFGVNYDCALMWGTRKGSLVYGLEHPPDDPIHVAAGFDGLTPKDGFILTGTRQGRLYWWRQPAQ